MTGRAGLEGTFEDDPSGPSLERASGLINVSRQTETEVELIRNTIMTREGMFTDILNVLRRVPRRVLMVLKLNDLTRCVHVLGVVIPTFRVLIFEQELGSFSHDHSL